MKIVHKRPLLMLSIVGVLCAFGVAASGETADALLRRYPYDPACPWGRVGNGKGLIVRCLSEAEATALRSGAAAPSSTAAPPSAAPAPSPTVPSSTAPAPSASADEPSADAEPVAPPNPNDERLDVTVGPVTAETGQLGIGKLGAPRDRYVKCVNDNGGLKDSTGEVDVKFLVRQRGRAEGVSVAKRVNVSAEAARCVSEVVDRRYVGTPEAPIVGATVTIKFAKAAK